MLSSLGVVWLLHMAKLETLDERRGLVCILTREILGQPAVSIGKGLPSDQISKAEASSDQIEGLIGGLS